MQSVILRSRGESSGDCGAVHRLHALGDWVLALTRRDLCPWSGRFSTSLLLCKVPHDWIGAKEAGVDISQYAERFLTQMLYTEQFFDGINDVYLSCRETCGNSLAEAYFHYFSYQNFVNGRQAPEGFFQALKEWRESGQELHEICGLALLA